MVTDAQRDRQVRQALAEAELDALICRLPENLVCLTGYYPQVGFSFVVYPTAGEPVVVAPRPEREQAAAGRVADVRVYETWRLPDPPPLESVARLLGQIVREKQLVGKAIGYEGSFEAIAPSQLAGEPYLPALPTRQVLAELVGSGLVDATDALNRLRAQKTPREIEKLRLASEVAGLGLHVFKQQAQPGRTEAQVAAAVEAAIYGQGIGYRGVRYARGWAQVFSGPNTVEGWYYPVSSARLIQAGDLVMIELGTVVDGYWSDLTRTVVAGGKATPRQRELYQLVGAAQQASLAASRPGVLGRDADAAGRRILVEAGLGDCFVHHTGHGLGFRYHEPIPSVHPASTHTLAVGHVHSIEPGVYGPEFGGVRIEDDAVVLDGGARFLSQRDFDLE
ncbi:MAG TPA: Xaa-Pro peptidase family protein [Chloroflexota bacterium]|nr:Xaa-Pro peptidase family protein [Chloroflexota bacterium]